ncbi:MAG: hypothetical protein NZT92_06790 [Abditibacteriales bacterium]|nr:hypothetical protein [Abditibacteriales bacterium]MDW8365647.1 hypothetical protein [Abditibacteriales bacterium]
MPKDRCLVTTIVRDGKPACKVVAPAEPDWLHLGRRIAVRARELTRVQPIHTTPDQITEDDLRTFHLCVVGNATNNDLIRRLHEDAFCFTTDTYPGGRGFEVRTVHDPFGHRKNVVLVGGSTYEGAKRATDFLTRHLHQMNIAPHLQWGEDDLAIARLNVSESASHVVPPAESHPTLLKECLEIMGADAISFNAAMERICSFGYYYYYTDRDEWAQAFKTTLLRLEEMVWKQGGWDTGRWMPPCEWLWKLAVIWDLIEESLCFTDDDRATIDNLLLQIASAYEDADLEPFDAKAVRRIRERRGSP